MAGKLKNLGPNHKAACRLRIEGLNNEDIAKTLNITKRTLEIWFSEPLVKEYIAKLAENVEELFTEKLATGGLVAVQQLTALLQLPDTDQSLGAGQKVRIAETILDRLPGASKVVDRHPQGQGDTNVLNLIAGLPDHQLAEYIQRWQQGELGSGDGDVPTV